MSGQEQNLLGATVYLPNAAELMRFHVAALFTCDESGRLLTVQDAGGVPAPSFFLGRTAGSKECWFRHDIGAALADDLRALSASQPSGLGEAEAEPFIARLSREEPVRRIWTGPAFYFPRDLTGTRAHVVRVTLQNVALLSPYLEDWRGDVSENAPMLIALEHGKAVSICASVRITSHAHEAGVDTHRDFRRRGHAAEAVIDWARAVRELDRIPLYSTSWENAASLALAKRLGLIQFGSDLHIS